ncbi:asparagine synthetase B family protein [Aeoliella sp.]|uniref:asparagine synthetase B family protein n=1 Tax=Aeoliella sp. TaxID=2795800 RepID=UPI003CCBD72C
MSALFGFTGTPERDWLAAMGRALAHRGGGKPQLVELPAISVGYDYADNTKQLGIGCGGVHRQGDALIVAAGFFTALLPGDGPPLARLLDAYLTRGSSSLEEVHGDFVFVVFDGRAMHLVRDPAGARSVYYGQLHGRWFFAIEPKGLLAVPEFPRRLRAASLAQYLAFSFVPPPHTMLKNVMALPAGHVAVFDGYAPPRVERYFQPEKREASDHRDEREIVADFRSAMSQAVSERLHSTGPVGVFLSGGLDSSLVAAEVARQAPGRVKTYALHFGPRYPNELSFAREVADRAGTVHREVLLRPRDFLPRIREMIWQLDDPIGDPITMPNYELSRLVARDHRVVFNGEGGDPCFGGPKNLPMMLQHWYGGVERGEMFRERAYLASYRRAYEEVSRLLAPEVAAEIDYHRDLEQVLSPYFQTDQPRNFLNKLMAINIRLKGAQLILPKVERMTGAAGLAPLAPLFAGQIIALSMQLPPRLKLHQGIEKVILKRAYADLLPQSVIERPKSGMRVPVNFWFRGEMRRYARKVLSRSALEESGIFQPQRVKQLLDYSTEEGPGRYGLRLWMLLTFELWRRIVLERESL